MEGHRCQQITSNERCPGALRLSNHRGSEGPPLSTEYLKGALRHQGPHRLRHHRGSEGPPLSTKYLITERRVEAKDCERRRERIQRATRTTFSRSEGPPLSTKYLICERLQRHTRTTFSRSEGPPLSTKYLICERLQRQTRTTFSRSEGPPLSTKYLICERLQRQTRTTRGGARGHRFQQNTSSVNDSSVKRERPEAERGATAFNKIPHLQHLSSGLTAARRYTARRHQAP